MDSLFETSTDEQLILAYKDQGRTLDDLPYTPQFEAIFAQIGFSNRADLFHRLHNLRKAGRLPRLGRGDSSRPRIEPEAHDRLVGLVEGAVGRLSLRDRLPFTAQFDELVDAFNAEAGLDLSRHDVWRLVATLAK